MKYGTVRSLSSLALVLGFQPAFASGQLFISEYVEGSSSNKAIEIYNGTGAGVDLSTYALQFFANGSDTSTNNMSLSGTLAAGDVYVLADSAADAAILDLADQTASGLFNGDDAVVLLDGGAIIDAIGQVGVDPGSEWGTGDVSTADNTLRRMTSVCSGDANASDTFDPSLEWDGYPTDTFDGLGSHTCSADVGTDNGWVINEILADPDATLGDANGDGIVSTTDDEFVELVNNNGTDADISGWVLSDEYGTRHSFPAGTVVPAGGAVVVFAGGSPSGEFGGALVQSASNGSLGLNNGGDTVTLSDPDGNVVVSYTYGGEGGNNTSLTRSPDVISSEFVAHSGVATTLFSPGTRIDGTAFVKASGGGDTDGDITLIHDIQGNGAASPIVDSTVTVRAVVVGDFQGEDELKGFFLQEEDADTDADPATSEGVFVYHTATDVSVGDVVEVTATVKEYYDLTELASAEVTLLDSGVTLPTPAAVALPFASADTLERYEGMRVALGQKLTVTENYNLGRYGEVWLSSGGRLMQPTSVALSGSDALAVQVANDLNRILVDDGSGIQNPDPIAYPSTGLTAFNTLRTGDTVTNLTGVLVYSFGSYRIHPTITPNFVSENPRTAEPVDVGGSLKVASFNVLNYFNGDGQGGGFPTSRGANTYEEFVRQHDKIVAAISAMNADIIGLMEIENDGYGSESAIAQLVAGLNAAAPSGTSYGFIDPGIAQIGSDEIAVGLIYRRETVTPVGTAAILDASVDSRFIDTKNRPMLTQSFDEIATGGRLTVAVNHLKSKGSDCEALDDPDAGDGQGNCNLTRTSAAEAMVDWLASDPTGSGDADFLLIGDLNAYAKEDPIAAIKAGGYSDLLDRFVGTDTAYSYVYMGQSGYLDHALASGNLTGQVAGATHWHPNADEPHVLDYNVEYKSADQVSTLYNADAYRASDHDPVLVGLNLTADNTNDGADDGSSDGTNDDGTTNDGSSHRSGGGGPINPLSLGLGAMLWGWSRYRRT